MTLFCRRVQVFGEAAKTGLEVRELGGGGGVHGGEMGPEKLGGGH